jgi:hypothetical protein
LNVIFTSGFASMYFSARIWKGLSMVLEVANDRENSLPPPAPVALPAEPAHPVRARIATVGTARTPAFRPEKRRCCVISSLSDFFVEKSLEKTIREP